MNRGWRACDYKKSGVVLCGKGLGDWTTSFSVSV